MRSIVLASFASALLVACSSVMVPERSSTSSTVTASSGGAGGGLPGSGGCGLAPVSGSIGSGGEGGEGTGGGAPFSTSWAMSFAPAGDFPRVVIDGSGMPLVLGAFTGTIDFGSGVTLTSAEGSGFLARISPSGTAVWAVPVSPAATRVVADSFTAVWVLDEETDPRVSRFDIEGKLLWTTTLPAAVDLHITPAADGGAFLAGRIYGPFQYGSASLPGPGPGPGAEDAFLLRINAAGDPVWVTSLSSLVWSTPAMQQDVRHLRIFDIAAAPGGGVVVAVNAQEMFWQTPPGCNGETSVLARIDASGGTTWKRFVPLIDHEGSLAVDDAGDVLLMQTLGHGESGDLGHGPLYGAGIGLAMYDPAGKPRWGKWFSGSAGAATPVFDAAGDITLAGSYFGSIDFGGGKLDEDGGEVDGRIFLARLSPHGAHLTSRSFTPVTVDGVPFNDDRGVGVAVSKDGAAFLGANYLGGLDLGTGPLPPSSDGYRLVIARVTP